MTGAQRSYNHVGSKGENQVCPTSHSLKVAWSGKITEGGIVHGQRNHGQTAIYARTGFSACLHICKCMITYLDARLHIKKIKNKMGVGGGGGSGPGVSP